jgi:UDP:flavonoid glycosyltransferase YjiC (YdhE family)
MPPVDRDNGTHRVACFVSPHGFGHAARLCAVADAVHQMNPGCRFDIFTSVPAWFFRNSMSAPFTYHSADTDLGMVQQTPFKADMGQTLAQLNTLLPFDPYQLSYLSYLVRRYACELIISDISPLGLAVGRQAGIPTVLIENFTWDWVYEGHTTKYPELSKHIKYLHRIFSSVDHHIQAEPVCHPQVADLTVRPIWRKFRSPPSFIRKRLGIPEEDKMVLITTGGIPDKLDFLDTLRKWKQVWYVLPGASAQAETDGNLVLLPRNTPLFHPDLVNASDAVVGKAGYSTLAEVFGAGVPFGHVSRKDSRESLKLSDFIAREMIGLAIEEDEFYNGSWMEKLLVLLPKPRQQHRGINGADRVAEYICQLLEKPLPDAMRINGPAVVENYPNQR